MRNYKYVAIILLLVVCTSIIIPMPVYASPITANSSSGILGFLLNLLSNILHINLGSTDTATTALPPRITTSTKNKDVLGFYAEWWGTDTSSYDDLTKHTDMIGTIAPFWATLHEDGSVTDRGGNDHASVVKYAHNNKITALLMVNNAKQGDSGIHEVLADPAMRKTAIDNLENYIKKYGLDGINIDFEVVSANDRDNLTAFMRELSNRLQPQGYIVSIDVFPKHNEDNDIANAYDYRELAKYADKIILMTYDYHGTWSDPGSVADVRSIETDLKYALTMIPKNKIYLGIAGYGYDWSSKGVESLEYHATQDLIDRFNANVEWDDNSKSPHFSYTGSDGVTHQVWYENSKSIKYKLNLVNNYDIAGIALWKLGEEDPASWNVIGDNLKH